MQLDEPVKCASVVDPLLLYKILYLLFFPLVRILCALRLDSQKKIINMVLMQDLRNFSFFGWGNVSPNHSELFCFVSGSWEKHQVSSPIIILLKKIVVCIIHRDNVLARCDSIFPLLRCQGVWNKTCTQLSLSQMLFHNLKNYSLGDVQRFCYHSWCDLTVIFDQISNSSNFYLSLSQFWMATSLAAGGVTLHYLLCNQTHPYPIALLLLVQAIFEPNLLLYGYPTIIKLSHSTPTCLWRWNRQSVPKRWHIKFRCRGITQKKMYSKTLIVQWPCIVDCFYFCFLSQRCRL